MGTKISISASGDGLSVPTISLHAKDEASNHAVQHALYTNFLGGIASFRQANGHKAGKNNGTGTMVVKDAGTTVSVSVTVEGGSDELMAEINRLLGGCASHPALAAAKAP